jgi:hypothetical protein
VKQASQNPFSASPPPQNNSNSHTFQNPRRAELDQASKDS